MTQSLLHVGFAKAGSTFLQEWFARHPLLHFTPHKLAGFGNVFDIADFVHDHPGQSFRYLVTSNELLGSGGWIPYGCPLYSFRMLVDTDLRGGQLGICRMLHDIFPGARVVIVTRGYASIIRSLYSQYVKLGGHVDFREFLEAYTSILDQWLDVDYNIRIYRDLFGDDRVIVLPYEMMKLDADAFIRKLEQVLGLEHWDEVPGARNPSLGPEQLYWYSMLSRYFITPVANLFHPKTAARVYSFYSFKVVRQNKLKSVIRLFNRVRPRTTDLTFPDGYLERFRGKADSLVHSELHEPFLDEYLTGPVAGRKQAQGQPASVVGV